MKLTVVVGIALMLSTYCDASADQESSVPWSSVYRKEYTDEECQQHRFSKELVFALTNHSLPKVIPFTQLIVSFNVERPADGSFDFFLRVHTHGKNDTEWEPWVKIAPVLKNKNYFQDDPYLLNLND